MLKVKKFTRSARSLLKPVYRSFHEGYDEAMYESYFALQNSSIFQNMLTYTIEKNLPDLTSKSVYDNGFGAGFSLNILLNKGLESYTGLDLSVAMVPYLTKRALNIDPTTAVRFVQGDNTVGIRHPFGPFDVVISCNAMYVDSAAKLTGFCEHLFEAVKPTGEVLLIVYHADYPHTQERLKVLAKYGHYLGPVLQDGERYDEFSAYQIYCKSPYFKNDVTFDPEFVVRQESLLNALSSAGFPVVSPVDIVTHPGSEELLEFADAFNLGIYRCKKS